MTAAPKIKEEVASAKTAETKASAPQDPALAVPTVGRIVNMFKRDTETPLAALVTEVGKHDDPHRVTLSVFEPTKGPRVMHEVDFSTEPKAGYWSWPSRG
jgi:hypothetical protein